jgi:thiamine-phosphate pyrophosphorylase
MKVILITPPETVTHELETIVQFFEVGLDFLHVRKPGWSDEQVVSYLRKLPSRFLNRVALHGNSKIAVENNLGGIHHKSDESLNNQLINWKGRLSRSTHSYEEITEFGNAYDYYFLSPIFDSISKTGYKSSFDLSELKSFLRIERGYEIIALGGVDDSNVMLCQDFGFDGIALMGAIWEKNTVEERLDVLRKILAQLQQMNSINHA